MFASGHESGVTILVGWWPLTLLVPVPSHTRVRFQCPTLADNVTIKMFKCDQLRGRSPTIQPQTHLPCFLVAIW
jgi:hypothetical protein